MPQGAPPSTTIKKYWKKIEYMTEISRRRRAKAEVCNFQATWAT
jgi:hypothetical protein